MLLHAFTVRVVNQVSAIISGNPQNIFLTTYICDYLDLIYLLCLVVLALFLPKPFCLLFDLVCSLDYHIQTSAKSELTFHAKYIPPFISMISPVMNDPSSVAK